LVEYDPFMEELRDDPFPIYARLRAESPVHYLERHDSWALSRFEDIWTAGEDPETYRSPGPALQTIAFTEEEIAESGEEGPRISSLFGMNPPQHTALRKHLARLFTPKAVGRFEPRLRESVRSYIDEFRPAGHADVISQLGLRVSVQIACMIIGLPVEDGKHLAKIVTRFFAREPGVEGMPPDAIAASGELQAYLKDAVQDWRRRGFSDDNALGVYASAEIDGERFSDDEISQHAQILVVGGTETLPKVFSGGVLQLYRHPDQRAWLVANPDFIPKAFDEIARYEMPTQFLTRTLARDVELRGQTMRAGQGVLFLYRAANRDEAEFDEPDRFDIQRQPRRILSFGHGTHICIGQHAARLEAKVMYEELFKAIPDYEVVEQEVVPARSEFVAGYLAMPIRFEASA
jgi:cytochrome P450